MHAAWHYSIGSECRASDGFMSAYMAALHESSEDEGGEDDIETALHPLLEADNTRGRVYKKELWCLSCETEFADAADRRQHNLDRTHEHHIVPYDVEPPGAVLTKVNGSVDTSNFNGRCLQIAIAAASRGIVDFSVADNLLLLGQLGNALPPLTADGNLTAAVTAGMDALGADTDAREVQVGAGAKSGSLQPCCAPRWSWLVSATPGSQLLRRTAWRFWMVTMAMSC
jgi:hypothetical protein